MYDYLTRRRLLAVSGASGGGWFESFFRRKYAATPKPCKDLQDAYDAMYAARVESYEHVRDYLAAHHPESTVEWNGEPDVPLALRLIAPSAPGGDIPQSTTYGMAWSQSPERTNGMTLETGSIIRRMAHVYLTNTSGITSVDWFVDGVKVSTRTIAPYDLAGRSFYGLAWPYRTSVLSDGPHEFNAVITKSDGTQEQVTRNLTVRNFPVNPTVVTAPAGGTSTLQSQINNAGGNTKIVVPAGTYGRITLPAKTLSLDSPIWIACDPGAIFDGGNATDNTATVLIRGGGYILDGGAGVGGQNGAIIRDTWRPLESPTGVTITDLWVRGGIRVQNAGAEGIHYRENVIRLVDEDTSVNGTGLAGQSNAEAYYLGTDGRGGTTNTLDCVLWNVRALSYLHDGIEAKDGCINTTLVDCYANGNDANISGRDQFGTAAMQTKGKNTRWLRGVVENAAWHGYFNYNSANGSANSTGTEYHQCGATARADNTQGYGYKMSNSTTYLSGDSTATGFPLGRSGS